MQKVSAGMTMGPEEEEPDDGKTNTSKKSNKKMQQQVQMLMSEIQSLKSIAIPKM
tara:strand:- start:1770 stop:1934 length:165 start_codon:yes stop_codon:yes gene_type:complete